MRNNNRLARALAAFIVIATTRVAFGAVNCGDTITSKETMTADLNCATEPALTVGDGGTLDMNAFKVTCNGTANGIVLNADGASVSNGAVGGCSTSAIKLEASSHKVTAMQAFNSPHGIYSTNSMATGIKIKDSAVSAATDGIFLAGGGNAISGVSVSASSRGIHLVGDGNKVEDVTIIGDPSVGIALEGSDNKVANVRVAGASTGLYNDGGGNNKYGNIHSSDYSSYGMEVGGDGNQILASTAIAASGDYGVYLSSGMRNVVKKSATLAGLVGIETQSEEAEISKNRVFGGIAHGIRADSSNATITKNVGLGAGTFDFIDLASGCSNTWSKNIGTTDQACVQ